MGLDNIPSTYACKNKGTAVMIPVLDNNSQPIIDENGLPEVALSCEKTQEAGGCPWKIVLGDRNGKALGLFGTDCWYRGKYGVWLLEQASDLIGNEYLRRASVRLFGQSDDIGSGHISRDDLHFIADTIQGAFQDKDGIRPTEIMITEDGEPHNIADDLWYLADWCRFTALYCDGAESWY